MAYTLAHEVEGVPLGFATLVALLKQLQGSSVVVKSRARRTTGFKLPVRC